ncbi:MAG TPA: hypothetical protein VEH31_37850 [Streptosporangiaceae bacterium]|nr:hypothetical protein [Streptosporangiaceae bacterium]
MFCKVDDNGNYYLAWTENGRLLAVMFGGPHDAAWPWWQSLHHSTSFPGSPSMPMQTHSSPPAT